MKPFVFPILVTSLALLSINAHGNINATVSTGVNSNPFNLTNKLSPEEEYFTKLGVNLNYHFDNGFFVGAKAKDTKFTDNRADITTYNANVGYRLTFDKYDRLDIRMAYSDYDKTYISRFTGKTATSRGQPIPDRYDNVKQELRLDYRHKINKKNIIRVRSYYQQKDYFDYIATSLSNLDYDEFMAQLAWKHNISKFWFINTVARFKDRYYDDKRAKDSAGNSIESSNLEYRYYRGNISSTWRLDKKQRVTLSFDHELKLGNYSSYFDRETTNAAINWRYKFDDKASLTLAVRYNDFRRNNEVIDDEVEEQDNSIDHNGYRLDAKYKKMLLKSEHYNLAGFIRANWLDDDSDREIYQYDRSTIELGVRASF